MEAGLERIIQTDNPWLARPQEQQALLANHLPQRFISRLAEQSLRERVEDHRKAHLVIGPRQAGKTTLSRSLASDTGIHYLSFDEQTILRSAQNDPAGFIEAYKGKKIILDEFQYVPELVPAIKNASDTLPPTEKGKFCKSCSKTAVQKIGIRLW